MCGRTVCALAPDVICRACSYRDPKTNQHKKPDWREHPEDPNEQNGDGKPQTPQNKYYPSANIPPTRFTPILFKAPETGEYVVQPMMWGMIPFWHKGEAKSHGLSSNNCRLEGIKENKLYRRSVNQRKVCVVLAQGFYEWKSVAADKKAVKKPYFIYMPQSQEEFKTKIYDESVWNNAEWNETEGWKGPNILMMAGLYDVWMSAENLPVYSYTIITMESNQTLSWLHDRMPAILDNPEQVHAWLNVSTETDIASLISILKPVQKLEWYPVSIKVNSGRCHDMDCNEPTDLKKEESNNKREAEIKAKSFLANWLKKGQPPAANAKLEPDAEDQIPEKKPKCDDL